MPMLSVDCYAQDDAWRIGWEKGAREAERRHEAEMTKEILADLKDLQNSHCRNFQIWSSEQQFQFQNLKGLNINIEPTEAEYSQNKDIVSLSNSSCFIMPTVNYIKAMGFNDTGEIEHTLTIYLKKINAYMKAGDQDNLKEKEVEVTFQIEMTNIYGEVIFEQVVSSSYDAPYMFSFSFCLNSAYPDALEKINWYKIASFLKESSEPKQQAKEESKEVKGYGNTALENTIVRWDVQSRPAGADVFWRVVSKTPSVKSTNNKYLQTTPYEATKSLDIRGLSYENSGDVRVILRCEKEGYYPQEKEFNVRMILDQEEISAFFRLVKEEK